MKSGCATNPHGSKITVAPYSGVRKLVNAERTVVELCESVTCAQSVITTPAQKKCWVNSPLPAETIHL